MFFSNMVNIVYYTFVLFATYFYDFARLRWIFSICDGQSAGIRRKNHQKNGTARPRKKM